MKIGLIVRQRCLDVLGVEPNITIDFETRLSFSLEATELELDTILGDLPQEVKDSWMVLDRSIHEEDSLLFRVEMKPRTPPSLSTHISIIEAINTSKARPVQVRRTWEGKDYFYDCLVSESVKDQYLAGDVAVGDYVIVHFDDIGEQIVTAKVFKSW